MSSITKKSLGSIILGEFGSNSHPIHPATVHFPIAFIVLANFLNLVYGSTLYLPTNLPFIADKENLGTLAILSYFSNILGIITSIPAVLTGLAELNAMVNANGLYKVDEKTGEKALVPKVKTTFLHAGLSDIVVAVAVYNWLAASNTKDFKPTGSQVLISSGALLITFYTAYLGGSLVYGHGVGVQRMGSGAEKKQQAMEEYAAKKE